LVRTAAHTVDLGLLRVAGAHYAQGYHRRGGPGLVCWLNGATCAAAKEKWSLSRFFRPIRNAPSLEQLLREDSTFSIVGVVDDPQLSPID